MIIRKEVRVGHQIRVRINYEVDNKSLLFMYKYHCITKFPIKGCYIVTYSGKTIVEELTGKNFNSIIINKRNKFNILIKLCRPSSVKPKLH